MKTTFDLPEQLLRRAKSVAARQGRPLRDLVAEGDRGEPRRRRVWPGTSARQRKPSRGLGALEARLERLPDGSWLNPAGIDDESFFRSLEAARAERWSAGEPLALGD